MRLALRLSLLSIPIILFWPDPPQDAPIAELHPAGDDASPSPQAWLDRASARAAREAAQVHQLEGRAIIRHQGSGLSLTLDDAATLSHAGDAPASDAVTVSMRTAAVRQGDQRVALEPGQPAVDDCDGPRCRMRAVVDQGALISWWEHAPGGIEQGWTVPAALGDGALVVEVTIDQPVQVVDGALRVGAEGAGLTGGALAAWDATGRPLEVDAVATLDGFELSVDVEGAAWPVTVDPVWTPWAWQDSGIAESGFGDSVALDGDINGDGFADALVGAPGWSGALPSSGRVWLYLGGPAGLSTTAAATWTGTQADERLGASVAFLGDVNGDGLGDFALGADGHDGVHADEGAVWVFHGRVGAPPAQPQSALKGGAPHRRFGGALAGAGDVNGDGYKDLVAGSGPLGERSEGVAAVWFGGPRGISLPRFRRLLPSARARLFGYRVAGLGDLNGDGLDEVAVTRGSFTNSHIDLYPGLAAGRSVGPFRTLQDTDAETITAGDFNGDGHRDLLGRSYARGVSVWWGSQAGPAAAADPVAPGIDSWAAASGDMNDDGFDDVLLGAPWGTHREGRVVLLWGSANGLSASPLAFWTSPMARGMLGGAVSMGDADGDAYSDGLVGASGHVGDTGTLPPPYERGTTFFLRGGPLGPAFLPPTTEVQLAYNYNPFQVSTFGDADGDGQFDVVFTDLHEVSWQLGTSAGISHAVAGSAPTQYGNATVSSFEDKAPAMCDVNGDRSDDLILPVSLLINGIWEDHLSFLRGGPAGLVTPAIDLSVAFPGALHEVARCAGDVSGDGIDDLVIAGGLNLDRWEVWLGGAGGPVAAGRVLGPQQPYTQVAVGADVNGDGLTDLVGADLNSQELHVFLGRPGGPNTTPDMTWAMPRDPLERRGTGVESAGDVDGDGFDDLLVLASFSGADGRRGRVYLAPGSATGLAGTLTGGWNPLEPTASFTTTLMRGVGDLDGDGFDDIALGEEIGSNELPYTSLLAVYRGGPGGVSLVPWFQAPQGLTPTTIETPGDVNGDGRDDLLISVNDAPSSSTWIGAYLFFGDPVAPVLAPPMP